MLLIAVVVCLSVHLFYVFVLCRFLCLVVFLAKIPHVFRTKIPMYIYIYIYICLHSEIYIHTISLSLYTYIYIYIYTYMHIYIYIHVHIYAPPLPDRESYSTILSLTIRPGGPCSCIITSTVTTIITTITTT